MKPSPLLLAVVAGACTPQAPSGAPVAPSLSPSASVAAPLAGDAASAGPSGHAPDPAPVLNPPVAGDVPALLATSKKTRCPPHQVAPGLWVRFHCGAFDRVPNARKANPGKLRMLRRGTLHLDSAVGSADEAGDGGVSEATWKKALPPGVDHRTLGTEGPIMNQAQVGCCSAFSLAATMDNAIRRQKKTDSISPMHVWSHYFVEGMAAASTSNAKRPLAVLTLWPYDELAACKISQEEDGCEQYYHVQKEHPWDPAIRQQLATADAHGTWQITSVTCVAGPLCESAAPVDPGILAAYLSTGADLWAAMWIDEQAWYHPVGGSIADYEVPAAGIANNTAEGHGISLSGYDWSSGSLRFLVHNSWGPAWGDQGYAWVSEAVVRKYLQAAYKVTVEDLTTPPPPPGAPNALTDDDCPEDELVDSVTGRCATMCPGDRRSAAGKCPGR